MNTAWQREYPQGIPTDIHIPKDQTLASLLESTCKEFGDKTALSCMGTDFSFREFEDMASAFGSYLQRVAGLAKGDRLAIMLPNIPQFPIALFAAFKIGVVCVNTNPLYTPREMKHQFADSEADAIIILDIFLGKLQEIIGETKIKTVIVASIGDYLSPFKRTLINLVLRVKGMVPKHSLDVIPFKSALREGRSYRYDRPAISTQDTAVLQYTGGTTGISKGAMLTQRNLLANIYQIQAWAGPFMERGKEVVLTALPIYHVFALSVNFLAFLTMGDQMILVPKPIPIKNTVKLFKKYRITVMTGVNSLFNTLNHDGHFQALRPRDLKIVIAGGMALQASVAEEFFKITGTKVIEGFGLTEASPVTHCNPVGTDTPPGSIGLPLPSTLAKIVDDNGQEVPEGEVGELIVQGPQVMAGYWKRDDETGKTIRDGWLWTGDIARRDSRGYFFIVDRKKDMVIVSGFNVYPTEVEEILVSHPKVMEAAVIGVPDEKSGEAVKAFIVAKDPSLTEAELKDFCHTQLTAYKRPKHFVFVESLPKTNVGKILRRELRAV